jgi:hypothetical protein
MEIVALQQVTRMFRPGFGSILKLHHLVVSHQGFNHRIHSPLHHRNPVAVLALVERHCMLVGSSQLQYLERNTVEELVNVVEPDVEVTLFTCKEEQRQKLVVEHLDQDGVASTWRSVASIETLGLWN